MKRVFAVAGLSAAVGTAALVYRESARGAHLPAAGTPYVAKWYDDARAAVSFTFDDGLQEHADVAAPMLREYGFRGTFYVVAGLAREHKSDPMPESWTQRHFKYGEGTISWDEIRAVRDMGMEIGNHSMTHAFLNHIADEGELRQQIEASAALIEEHLGEKPATFAFPYNESTPRAKKIVLESHVAIRENWTDYGGATFTAKFANALADKAIVSRSWLVPMVHGIDGGFLPLSSKVFREHLSYLKQHGRELWVDTYADVARYQKEREGATLHVEESTGGEVTFYVSDDAAAEGSMPLTVVLPLPLNENSDDVTARLEDSDDEVAITRMPDRILISVRPNTSPVTVTWH